MANGNPEFRLLHIFQGGAPSGLKGKVSPVKGHDKHVHVMLKGCQNIGGGQEAPTTPSNNRLAFLEGLEKGLRF